MQEPASWHSFSSKLYISLSTVGHGMDTEFGSSPPAKAVLYSPDTKVPRTEELALRKAIPANTNMKAIQASLEDIHRENLMEPWRVT
ncbi:hypothetical protein Q3G72_018979 [Acer saccharum]|nr:hypothetical protein Q3G72_018979 [Acer saccharum]